MYSKSLLANAYKRQVMLCGKYYARPPFRLQLVKLPLLMRLLQAKLDEGKQRVCENDVIQLRLTVDCRHASSFIRNHARIQRA